MFRTTLTLAAMILGLAACTEDQTYPVTGQECHEDDPVLSLDAVDCTPPASY